MDENPEHGLQVGGFAVVGPPSFLQGAVFTNDFPNLWTYAVWRYMQASCVVLFPHHLFDQADPSRPSDQIVNALRAINPSAVIMLRMAVSSDWRNDPRGYGWRQSRIATVARNFGIVHGCWDVEPNNSWGAEADLSYASYTLQALAAYKESKPPADFKLGLPTLASGPGARLNPWLDRFAGLIAEFQTVWYNCYWQDLPRTLRSEEEKAHPPQWQDSGYGRLDIGYHKRFPDHLLICGEYGNSLQDRKDNRPTDAVIYQAMAEQYPAWLATVRASSNVYAVNAYILPGKQNVPWSLAWKGFWLTEHTSRLIGRWAVMNLAT